MRSIAFILAIALLTAAMMQILRMIGVPEQWTFPGALAWWFSGIAVCVCFSAAMRIRGRG